MTAARKTGGRAGASSDQHIVSTDATTGAAAGPAGAGGAGAAGDVSVVPRAGARTRGRPKTRPDGAFPAYRYASTDSLIPYVNNARTHSPAQIAKIAASIKEFGFTNPVLTDGKRGIIAGHGRVLAAQKLRMSQVPIIELSHLTPAQRRAYIIADNRLALDAGWDEALLAEEFDALSEDGFDLALTGFDPSEISRLMGEGTEGLTDPDDVPETPADPVTVLGDVWLLGPHRLLCGDSTSPEHVAKLMAGGQADLCFTSPPYAQQRDYKGGAIPWDDLMQGVFAILPLTHEAQVLVNLGLVHNDGEWMPYWDGWIEWMRTAGWRRFGWYVWDQGSGFPGVFGGRCAPSHEFIFHFNKDKTEAAKSVPTKHAGSSYRQRHMGKNGLEYDPGNSVVGVSKIPDTVWRVNRQSADGKHPAIYPVGLPELAIKTWGSGLIYEPFSGSGTTIIAAEMTGRACHAIELSPAYVDVAVLRWQAFTGQQATLESTGRSFAETQAERVKVEVAA